MLAQENQHARAGRQLSTRLREFTFAFTHKLAFHERQALARTVFEEVTLHDNVVKVHFKISLPKPDQSNHARHTDRLAGPLPPSANAGNTTRGRGLWYPLPMRTPRDTTPRPARIPWTHGGPARRFIVGLLLLSSLAACGQKGGLYREKKPESRLISDAALLIP